MKRLNLKRSSKKNKNKTVTLLVDFKGLAYRAKYTKNIQLNYKDVNTTMVYGILNTILSLAKKFEITKCVLCADTDGVSVRRQEYDGYKDKSNRPVTEQDMKLNTLFSEEYNRLFKTFPHFGFPLNILTGYEADDLLAIYCKQHKNDEKIIIITRDEDIYQCLDSNITIYSPDDKVKKTDKWFRNEYNIEPKDWAMVKAIAGCASDNVKGIKGVGEETALKYLTGVCNPNQTKKIEENHETVKQCLQVVTLPHPCVADLKYVFKQTELNKNKFITFCQLLGFRSILDNLYEYEQYFSGN